MFVRKATNRKTWQSGFCCSNEYQQLLLMSNTEQENSVLTQKDSPEQIHTFIKHTGDLSLKEPRLRGTENAAIRGNSYHPLLSLHGRKVWYISVCGCILLCKFRPVLVRKKLPFYDRFDIFKTQTVQKWKKKKKTKNRFVIDGHLSSGESPYSRLAYCPRCTFDSDQTTNAWLLTVAIKHL